MKKAIPRVHLTTLLALLWSVVLATGIGAQTRFAALEGEVTDERGAAIVGAQITVKNLATGLERTATTGGHGRYLLEHLPPGAYDIAASMSGMKPALIKGQQLLVGTTATINLQLAVGPVTEEVQISAATALVETTRSEIGQVIQRTELDSLPIVDRSFSSLALAAPTVQTDRVAGGLSIGGQRGFNNNHIVDGLTNRNQILGTQLIAFSQDWVEEFRVHTNGYDAQFGQASGGIVNAVTRGGGNQFHGRGFGFFRAGELDATPALTASKPTLLQQRPGGTFGGPLRREKLFFFTGFEYLNSDSDAIITSPHEVCAPPARRDAATNNCLAPTGDNTSLFLAKVDWMAGAKHLVNARYNRQDLSNFNAAVGGLSTVEHGRFSDLTIWAIAGAWTSSPSPHITNELRGVLNRQFSFGGVNAGQTFEVQRPSGLLGAPVNYGLIGQDWLQLVHNLSIIRGAHSLKFGAEFSNVRRYDNFRNFRDGRYVFTTDRAFNLADPATHPLSFFIIEGLTQSDGRNNLYSLFAQDSWRVRPRLTVNYGLRYDTDGSLQIAGAQRVHTWSPRLGFAVALDKGSKTVLRLSGGLYHDAEHTNLAGIFIHNTLLAKRAVNLNWNPALGGLLNPFFDPKDPAGSAARLRQFLAEAFARNRTPDLNAIPVRALVPSTNGIDTNFTVPENQQLLAGLSRQITPSMSVSADYIYSKSRFLLVFRDTNVTPAGTRPNPNFAAISNAGSYGRGQYSALALSFDLRQTKRHGGFSYTLARCNDNTGTILQGGSATSPFNLEIDRGACDNDVRHTLMARGGYNLPFGLEASTIYTYRSAPPFSATTTALPLFTRFEPRNRRRADDFSSWDLRFGRNTRITEHVSVRLFAEFFNLLNQRNFTSFVSNNLSSSFLKPTSAFPPRRIQFGARVDF